MTSVQLLSLCGVITKDPNHEDYSADTKYLLLTVAQQAIAKVLPIEHLSHLNKLKVLTSGDLTDNKFALPSDFLKENYFEIPSTKVSIRYVTTRDLENRWSSVHNSDLTPEWIIVEESSVRKVFVYIDTNANLINSEFFYIKKPDDITASVNPSIQGIDGLLLSYFKYLFHNMEGQTDLSASSYKSFQEELRTFIGTNQNG